MSLLFDMFVDKRLLENEWYHSWVLEVCTFVSMDYMYIRRHRGQPIKLIQLVSTSEFNKYWWNNVIFSSPWFSAIPLKPPTFPLIYLHLIFAILRLEISSLMNWFFFLVWTTGLTKKSFWKIHLKLYIPRKFWFPKFHLIWNLLLI